MSNRAGREMLRRPLFLYDLPPEVLNDDLLLKSDIDAEPNAPDEGEGEGEDEGFATGNSIGIGSSNSIADGGPSTANTSVSSPKQCSESASGAQACSLCGLQFTTVEDQRGHLKSDLHNYNLKQKVRGKAPVSEAHFEKLIEDLDESLSGSESEDSEDGDDSDSMLSALLKRQARIESKQPGAAAADEEETGGRPGKGKPQMVWFSSPTLPKRTYYGVYRSVLTGIDELQERLERERQQAAQDVADGKVRDEEYQQIILQRSQRGAVFDFMRSKQLEPLTKAQLKPAKDGSLPAAAHKPPHAFLCMVGGGHFAAMVVSLAPRANRSGTTMDREAVVLAHKTFHRYTTRRKQGGSQSANDNAKGKANSAGATLRRYNEQVLVDEIRALLQDWKPMIDSSELLFVRATGTTNRRTLFGPYDGQVLRQDDPRLHGFPFSTRRPTQNELMRSFIELTRLKVQEIRAPEKPPSARQKKKKEAEAERRKEAKGTSSSPASSSTEAAAGSKKKTAKPKLTEEEETAALHTSQIQALLRRSKLPALLSYLTNNDITADFALFPAEQHRHAPRALHLAASQNSAPLVLGLLVRGRADPTAANADGKTAFELAGERAVRDAFRVARAELGEQAWDWAAARVPAAMTKEEADRREERERAEADRKEAERRRGEEERLAREGPVVKDKASVKQQILGGKFLMSPQDRREAETRGMTPEMKMRLERERRARAAEERIRKMQAGM